MHASAIRALLLTTLVSAVSANAEGLSAKIWNEKNRGHVQVTGSAPQFPDGTQLRVEVLVKGNFAEPIVGAFFRVRVKGGQFSQEEKRPNVFAPLTYTIKLKLQVSGQIPQVRKILEQKFGWPQQHIQDLDFTDVQLGTEEESAEFRLGTLRRLRTLTEELYGVHETLEPAIDTPVAENPAWEATKVEFVRKSRALGGKIRRFNSEYAALPDDDLVKALGKSLNKLSTISQDMEKGVNAQNLRRDIGRVRQWIDTLHADVNGRLPVSERNQRPLLVPKNDGDDGDEEDVEEDGK